MRLTKGSDFALRTIVHLAEKPEGTSVTNRELAQTLDISAHHLYKIVQALVRGGILLTSPGREGGVRLNKPPGKITLLEVIKCIEGSISLTECMAGSHACTLSRKCRLRRKIEEAQSAVVRVFAETTIEDLLDDH